MTKEKLVQLKYLNREIISDTDELVKLKSGRLADDYAVYGKMTEEEIRECEAAINEKIRRSKQLKKEITEFINGIEDSLTRQVIFYRYIKGMTWGGVAYMTGGYNSEENVRKIAERYLKKHME